MRVCVGLALVVLGPSVLFAQRVYEPGYEPGSVHCVLRPEPWGYGLQGNCVREVAAPPAGALARTDRTRFWPLDKMTIFIGGGPKDESRWRGYFVHSSYSQSFEIVREPLSAGASRLVIRTENNGWVVVQDWRETSDRGADLAFRLNYASATDDDIAILSSAMDRLRTIQVWDRKDDRNCANDPPGSMSLFCLLAASVEGRMGRYHHSQPALDIVRAFINERWPDRLHGHGLMDFNNDQATTVDDLRTVLDVSIRRAGAEAGAKPK